VKYYGNIKAVILLGIMGLIFGAVLAFAAQNFAVEVDEREAKYLKYFLEQTVVVVDTQVVVV